MHWHTEPDGPGFRAVTRYDDAVERLGLRARLALEAAPRMVPSREARSPCPVRERLPMPADTSRTAPSAISGRRYRRCQKLLALTGTPLAAV
jgi:hypothetical protein